MEVRWWGRTRGVARGFAIAGAGVAALALALTYLVAPSVASQKRVAASQQSAVNPFFEVVEWRLGNRRKLVRIRVVGVTAGEHVTNACSNCGHASFRRRWGSERVVLAARRPLKMSGSTRIIVGVTASNSIGRWIVIGLLHHQYRGLQHGCMPSTVTTLTPSQASDPSSIPKASCAGPCPSPTGIEYVEWKGTDGILWEIQLNSRQPPLALPIGSGALGSQPAVVVRAGGQRDAFWKGLDGRLTEMWYGGFWNGPIELRSAGRLRSAPAAVVDTQGVEHVFWRGRNGWLWELSDPGGVWSASYPVDSGPIGSTPSVVPTAGGGQDVFWRGTGGKLWEIRDTSTWGLAHELAGAGTMGSAPAAVMDASGVEHVFWKGKGANGWLWEVSDPGGRWGESVPLNSGPVGSAPTAVAYPGGEIDVFWKGTDGRLRELRSSGSGWRNPIRIGASGTLGSRPTSALGRCH